MKQGWEIKKLGEVATYVNGYAFKPEHWGETGMPIIRIQNLNNPNAEYNYCDADIPEKFVVENGDILISWSASLGVYEWNRGKAYLNQHIFKVVFNKVEINKYFLKYAVNAKLNDMLKDAHGATMKHIVKGDFDNTIIPYPPREEQERIVAELDCLSGVIEKKREQLRELDALAQSIFYQMFGDPITNEKGWEVKKWEEVFDTRTGKLNANVMNENGRYPFFTCSKDIFYIDTYAFDCEALLLAGNNATANYDVKYYKGKFNAYQRTYVLTLKDNSLYKFFKFALENKLSLLQEQSIGGMTKYLTLGILHKIEFIAPPLTLQQEFADKIEAIEKQKELIKQSITQTEELFNSRMDYYFN